MNSSLQTISLWHLALAFVPAVLVLGILFRWSLGTGKAIWSLVRMLTQLLLVGYFLAFVFAAERPLIVLGVLAVMLVAASWISLGPLGSARRRLLPRALAAITGGGVFTLIVVTQMVLDLEQWFEPRMVVPLAGMIFANAMNAVSLAAERFDAEASRGEPYVKARHTSLRAALIPQINALLAVGIVSFPGMMTGQILSGVDPLIAVRYQVMVMCMVFGASGISAALYLRFMKSGSWRAESPA